MEDTICTMIMVTIFAGIIALACVGINGCNKYQCRTTAEITEVEYRYHWLSGCFYKEDGKWVKQNENNADGTKVYVKGVK